MRADINIIAGLLALAIISGSSGFHVHGRVPSPLRHSSARQVRNRPEVISEAMLSRGGQAGIALGSTLEGLGKSRALKSLSRVLTSIVDPAISGGLLSGGLHAITGPDHLAALIAPSVGKSGFTGLRIGALWGVGHGISAMILGLSAFFLKGQFTGKFAFVEKMASAADSVVGISILFIGLMGIKESLEQGHGEENAPAASSSSSSLFSGVDGGSAAASPTGVGAGIAAGVQRGRTYRAILANGMLHGFSWDGAPSLAPALAMSSLRGAVMFLLSYSIGTIITMSLAAGTVGELSTRVGQASNNPDLPRKLSLISSIAAVIIGLYLIAKATILR